MRASTIKAVTAGCYLLSYSLIYPAWQLGKWLSVEVQAAVMESVGSKAEQMDLAVGPGIRIIDNGRSALALGHDVCPEQRSHLMRTLFGDSGDAGTAQCIVVTPKTETVRVLVVPDDMQSLVETWTVERRAGHVSFRRPDGSVVTQEKGL